MDLSAIPAFASDDIFHVVVEAPRGATLKLKYEPKWEAMSVSRPLPIGLAYPFDWGFVPSTQGCLTPVVERSPLLQHRSHSKASASRFPECLPTPPRRNWR
jgi:hypothetical protein